MTTQGAAIAQIPSSGVVKPKILRIGIIQGGRIVEERLVRRRENITIGQSAKNTFVVPSDALPRQWLLFELAGNHYQAHFSEGMDARIAVGSEIISLAQLKQTGKIQRRGQSYILPLDERSRGKIVLGDMTILFQFVTPPPPQPRPQLPSSVRGSLTSDIDWFFTTIAGVSFLFHLLVVIYLRNVDWPRKPDIEEIPDRFVKMVALQPKKEEPKKADVKKEEKADDGEKKAKKEAQSEKKKEAKPQKRELTEEEKAKAAEDRARAEAERRARIAEQVKSTGLLKLLGAKADGGGSLADVLGRGDVDRDQEKAFQGIGGVGLPNGGDAGLRGIKSGGSGTGKVASVGGLRGGAGIVGGETGSGPAEKKVAGIVKSEAPAVDGELDPGIVAKEVRSRLGAVKACYERGLKRNPGLSGKIVIHWTITAAGTVASVEVENDTMGDNEVAGCIKSLVSRWRFPAPSGGSVEVSFPFVFQSSQ